MTMPLQLLTIWVHEAILIPMDRVVILRVTAVRLITESPGRGLNSMVENPDHRDFSGNIENTPLMSASSSVDLNIDQDRNGEVRNVENFEDSDFPALRPNYDRQAHTHHNNWNFMVHILKRIFWSSSVWRVRWPQSHLLLRTDLDETNNKFCKVPAKFFEDLAK